VVETKTHKRHRKLDFSGEGLHKILGCKLKFHCIQCLI
jgi:hypothetical protein